MSVVKILIGADLVPTKTNEESFIKADVDKLADEKLREVLKEADYRIFNLEVPLTDKRTPISKNGPNLIAPSKTVNGIKAFNVDFLTLANNHILDQGKIGLASTEKALQEAGINYAGVGNTAKEASRPYIAELGGKKSEFIAVQSENFLL